MAVVGTAKLASAGVSGSSISYKSQKLVARYVVDTDSESDGVFVVLAAPGLPSEGTKWAYGNDAGQAGILAVLKDYSPTRKTRTQWIIDCNYEYVTQAPGADGQGAGDMRDDTGTPTNDPEQAIARVVPGYVTYTEVVDRAKYLGNYGADEVTPKPTPTGWTLGSFMPICNSTGVAKIPPVERQIARPALRVTSLFPTFSVEYDDWLRVINSDAVNVVYAPGGVAVYIRAFAPKTVLIYSSSVQPVWFGTRLWYELTLEMHINKKGWYHDELDEGYLLKLKPGSPTSTGETISSSDFTPGGRFATGYTSPTVRTKDDRGSPLNQKILLDGDGKALVDPEAIGPPRPEKAIYLRFQIDGEIPMAPVFNAFGL